MLLLFVSLLSVSWWKYLKMFKLFLWTVAQWIRCNQQRNIGAVCYIACVLSETICVGSVSLLNVFQWEFIEEMIVFFLKILKHSYEGLLLLLCCWRVSFIFYKSCFLKSFVSVSWQIFPSFFICINPILKVFLIMCKNFNLRSFIIAVWKEIVKKESWNHLFDNQCKRWKTLWPVVDGVS